MIRLIEGLTAKDSMRKFIWLQAVLICLLWTPAPVAAQDEGIQWLGSYKEALQEAKRTRKPIFLEFRCEA
jgi:hypothetical protein